MSSGTAAASAARSAPPTPAAGGGDALTAALGRFFDRRAPLDPGDTLLVAFSGGPDSTALLAALAGWAPGRDVALAAVHLDHGLDPGSAERARAAEAIAASLGVPCTVLRRTVRTRRGESPEAAARRVRYEVLERERRRRGARWIATAHHRDDQAETVLVRLLAGSGPAGLAGIRPAPAEGAPGRAVRPLLDLARCAIQSALASCPLPPLDDPTNRDLARPRNRVRHRLLPALAERDPELPARLAALAGAAAGAADAVERRLERRLAPRVVPGHRPRPDGTAAVTVEIETLRSLPEPLLPAALALLHRLAGAPHPPGRTARGELKRQLYASGDRAVGCDCGDGWRWRSANRRLTLDRRREEPVPFTYTLQAPGTVEIPELSLRFRLVRSPVEEWMFRGERRRAGLDLPLAPGAAVTVRSRQPGDRLRPLGAPGRRRLKEVLIDRRVPRRERDRLPLLCLGAGGRRVAWVPGVTIDECYRLGRSAAEAWVASIEVLESPGRQRRLVE